jgi:NTE family protein
VLAALVIFAAQGFAQNSSPDAKRPTVGLALEGGGALGLAHVGVIKWLQEHRIPVDYVGGTSMGGLVGGFYAIGMSPAELQNVVSTINWDAVLGTQVAYRDLVYRRKQDRRAFQNALKFGLRGGFSAPGGLNSGQEITFLLDRNTLPYSSLASFDELPIPFRCVAANLTTGKPHVFDSGPLGEALRATMSLPAIFTPVKVGDSVYADGGLLDNLPVDVVKNMGASVVVAVYLDVSASAKTEPESLFSIMGRSIGIMIAANELHSMEAADVLISVDLKGFTAMSYSAANDIIAKGYEAAGRKSAVLGRFALNEDDWQRYLERRVARKRTLPGPPANVEIAGVNGDLKKDLETVLSDHAGQPFESQKLEDDLREIAGVGRYSRFTYHWVDPGAHLVVQAEQYTHAPPFLNLGIDVDGTDYNNVLFAFTGRVTALDVGGFRAEWRTDFSLGSTWGLRSEYFKPFTDTSRWFWAPKAFAVNSPIDLYHQSQELAAYRIHQYGGGLDVGYQTSRSSELRFGYDAGYFDSALHIGQPVLPTPSGRTGITSMRYDLDLLDSPIVPREGFAVRSRAQWDDAMPGATAGFPVAELYLTGVRRVSTPGSVFMQAAGGSTFGHQDTGLPQFFLGGPGRLGAYGLNELRGDQYFLGRFGYIHQLFPLPPLVGDKVFIISTYEIGKMHGPLVTYDLPMDGAVSLVAETFIGPISFGGSIGDSGHKKLYFQIGRIF